MTGRDVITLASKLSPLLRLWLFLALEFSEREDFEEREAMEFAKCAVLRVMEPKRLVLLCVLGVGVECSGADK